jgi:hypothetical protein
MTLKIENKKQYSSESKFLKGAIKAINNKQEETIQKANKIIGDVENFEKKYLRNFPHICKFIYFRDIFRGIFIKIPQKLPM